MAEECRNKGVGGDSAMDLSPMDYLSRDLSGTKLSVTPSNIIRGRRLSLSNLTPDTPASANNITGAIIEKENTIGASRFPFGLSKNVSRLSCIGNRTNNPGRGSLLRRMNSAPVTTGHTGNNTTPPTSPTHSQQQTTLTPLRVRNPLEDCDQNSQDSGYSAAGDDRATFRFTEPSGFPPRKSYVSPRKLQSLSPLVKRSPGACTDASSCSPFKKGFSDAKGRTFSFSSNDSFDDGFLELSDLDKTIQDENTPVPVNLGNLLTGQLFAAKPPSEPVKPLVGPDNTTCLKRLPLRRAFSLVEHSSPATSKVRAALFSDDVTTLTTPPFKRPRESENISTKRRKSNSLKAISENTWNSPNIISPRYKLQRSVSVDFASELHKSISSTELIADYSRPYALPVINGNHEDLKSITPETLAALLKGGFNERVKEFKIIDCRYPYEYEGGHIAGAKNYYTQELIQKAFFDDVQQEDGGDDRRKILIFHCEFSKERGPNLFRYLRRCDRNQNSYPSLNYPEMYLLHGGYKAFFAEQKTHCEPCSYLPMVDPKHESDLRKFRLKSNSWSSSATSFKRLAL